MSHLELQPGFDFQKAGKEVLAIEREGWPILISTLTRILPLPVKNCSGVQVR